MREIATGAALKKMVMPGAIAVFSPVLVGFLFTRNAWRSFGWRACKLYIIGSHNVKLWWAWDNAKKFVEKGNLVAKDQIRTKPQL